MVRIDMNTSAAIAIDLEERFPSLPRAPVVEAVIDMRARASLDLQEPSVEARFTGIAAGYRFERATHEFEAKFSLQADRSPEAQVAGRWKGLRCVADDGKRIAQFNRDGFVLSRLAPYTNWYALHDEAIELWRAYVEIARPTELLRIGVRYINRILLPPGDAQLEDYLDPSPTTPRGLDLPFQSFVHQDRFAVPGHPYGVNLIRTIEHRPQQNVASSAIILDIDAFTVQGADLAEHELVKHLAHLRWLKNKVFFGSIGRAALTLFTEGEP
jgi:uncharacterized protein (TIGR04255 family)